MSSGEILQGVQDREAEGSKRGPNSPWCDDRRRRQVQNRGKGVASGDGRSHHRHTEAGEPAVPTVVGPNPLLCLDTQ